MGTGRYLSRTETKAVEGITYNMKLRAVRRQLKKGDIISAIRLAYQDEQSPLANIVKVKVLQKFNRYVLCLTEEGVRECFLYQDIRL